jgi:hypothetical protein
MKKLLFISLLFSGIAFLGLVSCMEVGNEGNYQTFPPVPAVVSYDTQKGGTTLLTYWGEIATPELSKLLDKDDCLYVQFKIDYDAQPKPDPGYYVATVLDYETVDASDAKVEEKFSIDDLDDFTFPIDTVLIPIYNNTLQLNGRSFFHIGHYDIPNNQKINYKFVTCRDSIDEKTGLGNVYLLAQKENETDSKSANILNIHAFNLNDIIRLGKDSTVNEVKMKYVKVNLKYYAGEKEGEPIFEKYNANPIEMFINN